MSKFRLIAAIAGLSLIAVIAYKSIQEVTRDKAVIPQSGWMDSENLFPLLPNVKWMFPGMGEMLNVYAGTWLNLEAGDFDILKAEGTFPNARYFGITMHDAAMKVETYGLMDYEIEADEGHINPFVAGNERLRGQKYTVYFVKEGVTVTPSLKNVIVVPKHMTDVVIATRQYRADDDTPLNEVAQPYPVITVLHEDMTPGIAPPAEKFPRGAVSFLDFDAFEAAYDDHHAFQVNNGNPNSIDFLAYSGDSLGPNKDTRYLWGTLGGDFSKVAVVGIPKPPTFEHTRYGGPLIGGKNVRYWSFCHGEGRMGMVNDCVNDDRIKPNKDGSITLVIGPESIKDEVEAAGLTWLSWTRNRTLYKPIMRFLMYRDSETYDASRIGKKTMLLFRQVGADPQWEGSIINKATKYYDFFAGRTPFDPGMDERAELMLGDHGPRGFVLDLDTFREGLERGDFSKAFGSRYASSVAAR